MTTWQFFKKHWGMSLTGAVILLVALVSIIYAVVTKEGDDGFLKSKDGRVLKLDKEKLPLTCFYHENAEKEIPYYNSARNEINRNVGIEILAFCQPWLVSEPFPVKPLPGGVILVQVGVPPEINPKDNSILETTPTEPKHIPLINFKEDESEIEIESPFDLQTGGSTLIYQDTENGGIYGSIIYIDQTAPEHLKAKIWLHELGHALGLDHDRTVESIMYPIVNRIRGKLSKTDIERLKEAYR